MTEPQLPAGRPKFNIRQRVRYFIHEHAPEVSCNENERIKHVSCQRNGIVLVITWWRRSVLFAYRVTDQYRNQYWVAQPSLAPAVVAALPGLRPYQRAGIDWVGRESYRAINYAIQGAVADEEKAILVRKHETENWSDEVELRPVQEVLDAKYGAPK